MVVHPTTSSDSIKTAYDIPNMCINTISLCTSCGVTMNSWKECEKFEEFMSMSENKDVTPNEGSWVDKHGTSNPIGMKVKIIATKCPTCTKQKKKKLVIASLVEIVENETMSLAGEFELMSGKDRKVVKQWTKKVYQPIPNEVVTDTETEDESEDDVDDGKALATKNSRVS